MQQLAVHEVMELHELLDEKICMIDHFAMYISQCQDPQLRNMIQSHQQRTLQDYQMVLNMMHGQSGYPTGQAGMSTGMATGGGITSGMGGTNMSLAMATGQNQQIQYGFNQTQANRPQPDSRSLGDKSIAQGCLTFHKCGATRATTAALECSNSQLRSMFVNSARACTDMAYDVFQYMNQKGWYQVPTMDRNQMNQMMNSYQMPQQAQSSGLQQGWEQTYQSQSGQQYGMYGQYGQKSNIGQQGQQI